MKVSTIKNTYLTGIFDSLNFFLCLINWYLQFQNLKTYYHEKNPVLILLILSLSFAMMLSTGCGIDGCTDPMSDNYNAEATDDDGTCIPWRDKFMGQYTVSESCPSGTYTFEINIVAGASAADAIIINNVGDFGAAVNGTVNGENVTIPNQNITAQGLAVSINGSGSINGNLLIINYSYDFAGNGETCSMNCTKR